MKKIYVLAVIFIFLSLSAFIWWDNGTRPVDKRDQSQKVFVISKGETIREVGNALKKEGLIRDPIVFFLLIKNSGNEKAIQAGDYRLSPSMSLTKIIESLRHGTLDLWVTIPEGFRAEEISDRLSKDLKVDSIFREKLNKEEGYLFPDTYLIPKDATAETVISIMKNNFYKKTNEAGISQEAKILPQIITIASLIEREALKDDEKVLISSVIANRLSRGMALDIDATLQYIKGKNEKGKWWDIPTVIDKGLNSPYNTYKYPGIPPGPIANPGIEAIKAAESPAKSEYYFYIHDTQGNVHFAKTLEQHNQNIAKYIK